MRIPTMKAKSPQESSATPTNAVPPDSTSSRSLDIVFLQDSTGSQAQYIRSAREAIEGICTKISASTNLGQGSIRFGLIAFRDHPPQDTSFVTKNFNFTTDIEVMKKNLGSLVASGGGDGPEAQTAALAEALNMTWTENAVKIVVLITDAPPHGIGEPNDGFQESPDQNDPLNIVRQMAERGITLFVIACEPTLSGYKHAVDFYRAVTAITSGKMIPLVKASQLGDYIVGTAIEAIETESLINEFQNVILEDVYGQGKPVEGVMAKIKESMDKKDVRLKSVVMEEVYHPSDISGKNATIWASASRLSDAKGHVTPVFGSRMKSSYHDGASPSFASVPQAVNPTQTRNIVMASLMRSSNVGAGGTLTPRGAYEGKDSVKINHVGLSD